MLGFEVCVNGEKVSAALENGVVTVIITRLNTEIDQYISLDITGMDTANARYADWMRENLKCGDEIVLKVKELQEISKYNTREFGNESKNERKLKQYYSLKESLEKDGLLP